MVGTLGSWTFHWTTITTEGALSHPAPKRCNALLCEVWESSTSAKTTGRFHQNLSFSDPQKYPNNGMMILEDRMIVTVFNSLRHSAGPLAVAGEAESRGCWRSWLGWLGWRGGWLRLALLLWLDVAMALAMAGWLASVCKSFSVYNFLCAKGSLCKSVCVCVKASLCKSFCV